MLKQRVITALVLLAVLLPALLWAHPWPFALLTLVAVVAAGWEWGRLNGLKGAAAGLLGAVVGVLCAGTWTVLPAGMAAPAWLWWLALPAWVAGGALALGRGTAGWSRLPVGMRCVAGMAVLWLAWLGLTQARQIGLNFILSVFCLVWVADIAAYFGGRSFGRRKLAPAISPGKSWEGVWSGMAGVLVLAAAWLAFDRSGLADSASLYALLVQRLGLAGLVVGCLFLAAMSVVGDLFESLVKRSAGAKDSSQLLPGHGGVLDRIDALLPVFPLAMSLAIGGR